MLLRSKYNFIDDKKLKSKKLMLLKMKEVYCQNQSPLNNWFAIQIKFCGFSNFYHHKFASFNIMF